MGEDDALHTRAILLVCRHAAPDQRAPPAMTKDIDRTLVRLEASVREFAQKVLAAESTRGRDELKLEVAPRARAIAMILNGMAGIHGLPDPGKVMDVFLDRLQKLTQAANEEDNDFVETIRLIRQEIENYDG
jgi:hypothetical protein